MLFTIRTYVAPLDTVATPARAGRLADALEAMPEDVRGYKDLAHTAARVIVAASPTDCLAPKLDMMRLSIH